MKKVNFNHMKIIESFEHADLRPVNLSITNQEYLIKDDKKFREHLRLIERMTEYMTTSKCYKIDQTFKNVLYYFRLSDKPIYRVAYKQALKKIEEKHYE